MSKSKPYNTDQNDQEDSTVIEKEQKKLVDSFKKFLNKNPKRTFVWMVGILIFCIIANVLYSVFYTPKIVDPSEALKDSKISADPITQGLGKIVQAGASLNETMAIKEQINILLDKDSLSRQDSVKLLSLFQELEYINKKLLPIQKPKK